MSLENRLRRVETLVEDAGGGPEDQAPPVNEEHGRVRGRLREIEDEYGEVPADHLIDEWLDLSSADYFLSAGGEIPSYVRETQEALA